LEEHQILGHRVGGLFPRSSVLCGLPAGGIIP
jgi:hypothetical protein